MPTPLSPNEENMALSPTEGSLPSLSSTLAPSESTTAVNGSASGAHPGNGHAHPPGSTLQFDAAVFKQYLELLLTAVVGASFEELESIWDDEEWEAKVERFAEDSSAGMGALYVVKMLRPTEDDTLPPVYTYHLTSTLSYDPPPSATLALIKRQPTLDTSIPLAQQLHMLNLYSPAEGSAPYESLHSLVHLGVAPWFDAYVSRKGGGRELKGAGALTGMGKEDRQAGVPLTKRKFAELELSLLHLQQNVEIPEIHLAVNPQIQRVVDQAYSHGEKPTIDDLPPQSLADSSFLNRLQSDVNSWIKQIQTVTRLDREVSSGTASQEINFWLGLERELEHVDNQLNDDGVRMIMEVLRSAKRYRATVGFHADTGLNDHMARVKNYNNLMKDFPLNELLSATDLDKISDALYQIFSHLNKKLRLSSYPIRRALPLVEAISRDFTSVLLTVLASHRLMYLPYDTFAHIMTQTGEVFKMWDEQVKEFTNVAREVTRKRNDRFIPIKIQAEHVKLQERIGFLRGFRERHEQLRVMTAPGRRGPGGVEGVMDAEMEEEVRVAYDGVRNVDVLDVSPEGTEIWVQAETTYNERIARVENQIISRMRDRLGMARNASEMFRAFSKFNALFVRPKIRSAIQEYQTQLIESVKDDIQQLHAKMRGQYRKSEAFHMAQMRDLPEISSTIIWARQIERQLRMYMKRVEDVLGKEWHHYAEGQRLQQESESFRKKLDVRKVYEAWLHEVNRRDMSIRGKLFDVVRSRGTGLGGGQQYTLHVNYDSQTISLFKEVRNLLWLNVQIPHAINNIAKEAKRVYPHAISLMETVRTYGQTVELVEREENQAVGPLVAEYRIQAQDMIARGINYKWEYYVNTYDTAAFGAEGTESKHLAYIRNFATGVNLLQDKTNNAIELYRNINKEVEELSTCSYSLENFSAHLARIQSIIDKLNLEGYANLEHWVTRLDARIEESLLRRLERIVEAWCAEFDTSAGREDDVRAREGKRRGEKRKESDKDGHLHVKPIVHEIRIQNQVIFLDPPIEYARESWLRQLHEWLGVICGLRRIHTSSYEIGLQTGSQAADLTYTSLLLRLDTKTLERPFALVEAKVQEIRDYVAKWLQFQSLWDLEPEAVFARLGDSLGSWQQLLIEIKRTRATFDNSDTSHTFGVCTIDYEQVQSRVNAKYDAWQKDILNRFGVKLGNAMKEMHASITKARHDLENHSIEGLMAGAGGRRF
ncbi:hypothetical protein CALCODRAFT_333270 [Calocera cornea HHB12733]|uniref:Dynein heavy chain tail domain-containing protein n=1 Tax=Calocera cornea HHB12733 TaxID=1353952 RepID=A0A165F1M2_9BASI|nr:hypothetical protein CALCODRAFT_333270 [Calocera cornea HHB12733]